MTKLAIIRIRGQVRLNPKHNQALINLGLDKKFTTIIREDTPSLRGQIKTIMPTITWGEANEEIITALAKKYPKEKIYHLPPPRLGLGRKGIKLSYKQKGAFGYRATKINDLLKRMM